MRALLLLLISAGMAFGQLQGIIDIHTHGDPDSAARKIDVLELAKIAKAAGMRGIVLKNHYTATVQAALRRARNRSPASGEIQRRAYRMMARWRVDWPRYAATDYESNSTFSFTA